MSLNSYDISVVIPCYNEELVIDELLSRLRPVLDATQSTYEVIFIDDGSTDTTLLKLKAVVSETIKVIELSRNFGHQFALTAGLDNARGDRILIIDADLQDPPELLPDMLNMMDDGADVVYGQRSKREGEGLFKKLSASVFYRILDKLTDIEIPVDAGDFRLINRKVCDSLLELDEKNRFVRGMVSWVGYDQRPIPYVRDERYAGETKYPIPKMVKFAIDAITSFSIAPLSVAVHLAFIFIFIAAFSLIYALYSNFYLDVQPGWTSVVGIMSLLGAAQLVVLGIIGEYVGRLYIEAKQRPLYIIKNIHEKQ